MKNLKTLIATLALVLSFNTSFANDAQLTVNDQSSIILTVKNRLNDFKVKLIDIDSNRLFNEKFTNAADFNKKFNLKHLANGQYFLSVESDVQFQNFEINISSTDIAITEIENYKVFEPSITLKSNKLSLNILSINKFVKAGIKILNFKDEVIWEGNVEGENNLGKIYDISNLPAGTYYTQIIVDGKLYIKEFTQGRK